MAKWLPISEHKGFGAPSVLVGLWIRIPGIQPYFYRTVAHPTMDGWYNDSADEDLAEEPEVFMWMPDDPLPDGPTAQDETRGERSRDEHPSADTSALLAEAEAHADDLAEDRYPYTAALIRRLSQALREARG